MIEEVFRSSRMIEEALRPVQMRDEIFRKQTAIALKSHGWFEEALKPLRQQQEMMRRALGPWQEIQESVRLLQGAHAAIARNSSLKISRIFAKSSSLHMAREIIDSPALLIFREIEARHREMFGGFNAIARNLRPLAMAGSMALQPAIISGAAVTIENLRSVLDETEDTVGELGTATIEEFIDDFFLLLDHGLAQAASKIEVRAVARLLWWLAPMLLALYLYHNSSQTISELRVEGQNQAAAIEKNVDELAKQSEDREKTIILKFDELNAKFDRLLEEAHESIFYIVRRPVPLNTERRYSGLTVTWLMPGQEVELVERHGKWIKVIAYDVVEEQCQSGWVLKKYLRRIKR